MAKRKGEVGIKSQAMRKLRIKKMEMEYKKFLKKKVIVAESFGFQPLWKAPKAKPHQTDICDWALRGGRRAIFASFGLGKTFMQLIIAKNCIMKENKPFLIACPLGVIGEFRRDNRKLESGPEIKYITDTDSIDKYEPIIYMTNYERIRKGDIDANKFCGVSFDEASILRNLQTETTNYILQYFRQLPYRFVATATPSPNDYIELLNYANYLGVASRGHLLTRFFKRNSAKAGDLQLLENKKQEFWEWVFTWAVFINNPSDLGYDSNGYDLPKLNVVEHCISYKHDNPILDKFGNPVIFKDLSKSLLEVSREKRDSMAHRIEYSVNLAREINRNLIIWHNLEDERCLLEKAFPDAASVFGSQPNWKKEKLLIDFSEGKYPQLLTKSKIAGSGCNFQEYCHDMIFAGIDYKFNDFIQSVHRIYRFGQTEDVNIHIVFTENEQDVLKALKEKWRKHDELQEEMTTMVRKFGLNNDLIKAQMERQIFRNGDKKVIGNATLYNNDNTIILQDKTEIADNSIDFGLTSIPFGDHYEYSDFYNDYGHNNGNDEFFKQMDFLTPNLLRVLKPGRVFAVHVKDRIRYSYQNGTSFTTIDDFSGQTVAHFVKHGFYLMGKITVTTDVVAENNQTYRLGWSEQCKDASKMGVGLPEYVLLFRKAPTSMENAYSDEPVTKSKEDYTVDLWQLDAHAYWRSSGDVLLDVDDLLKHDLPHIRRMWKEYQKSGLYDFKKHKELSKKLDEKGKLSRKFMTVPPISNNPFVWDDIQRTNTLNVRQVSGKKEKHICPLQLDIIERLINRFSNPGDVIFDPFGGLFSVSYKALQMGRKTVSIELNTDYYKDGLFYVKAMYDEVNMPTLFDMCEMS